LWKAKVLTTENSKRGLLKEIFEGRFQKPDLK
jgi:hypothetical protein